MFPIIKFLAGLFASVALYVLVHFGPAEWMVAAFVLFVLVLTFSEDRSTKIRQMYLEACKQMNKGEYSAALSILDTT